MQKFVKKITGVLHRIKAQSETPAGKRIAGALRMLLTVAIIGYLAYQIYDIGVVNILQSLPRIPAYYLLFLLIYMLLPLSELLIYRIVLPIPAVQGFLAFLRKKILNTDIIGYSGEAFLLVWLRENVPAGTKKVFEVLKDNTIISSVASTFTALALMLIFAGTGTVDFLNFISPTAAYAILAVLFALLLALIFFRKRLISMRLGTAFKIYGIHQIRLIIVYGLEVFNWSLVVPEVPWNVWFTFLALKIIATRIPFLPSQDVLFTAVGMEFSKHLTNSSAAVSAVLLAGNVLSKLISLLFFGITGAAALKSRKNI